MTSILILLSCLAQASAKPVLDSSWGREVGHCKPSKSHQRHVWIFKQWHLAPGHVATFGDSINPPQLENQTALFRQLDRWLDQRTIGLVVAEGCSGKLASQSSLQINGWSVEKLRTHLHDSDYDQILTSVPLKLLAKYGDRAPIVCGDDTGLIKENALAFSDARGAIGFLGHLKQNLYLDGAIDLYHLPKSASATEVERKLWTELKRAVARAQDAIEKRNLKVVEALKQSAAPESAVVFGGVHAAGIQHGLEEAGLDCTIVEPTGYRNDEVELLQRMNLLIDQNADRNSAAIR